MIKTITPVWIKRIADAEIRNLVEQEYYINPQRATEYAKCSSAEEIKQLRQARYATLPRTSSIVSTSGASAKSTVGRIHINQPRGF